MVILISKFGRLGNRLVITIHAMACALKAESDFLSVFGFELGKLTGRSLFHVNSSSIRFLHFRIDSLPIRLYGKLQYALDTLLRRKRHPCKQRLNVGGRLRIISNWYLRNDKVVGEMASAVRSVVAFDARHRYASDAAFSYEGERPVFVGVHIRRTDYRTWHDGNYFWPFSTYVAFMDSLVSQMPSRKVRFILASDETIPAQTFVSTRYEVRIVSGNPFEDMCALSRCDYVMGLESTFSRVAAFLGNTMYHQISSPEDTCALDSFVRSPVP